MRRLLPTKNARCLRDLTRALTRDALSRRTPLMPCGEDSLAFCTSISGHTIILRETCNRLKKKEQRSIRRSGRGQWIGTRRCGYSPFGVVAAGLFSEQAGVGRLYRPGKVVTQQFRRRKTMSLWAHCNNDITRHYEWGFCVLLIFIRAGPSLARPPRKRVPWVRRPLLGSPYTVERVQKTSAHTGTTGERSR